MSCVCSDLPTLAHILYKKFPPRHHFMVLFGREVAVGSQEKSFQTFVPQTSANRGGFPQYCEALLWVVASRLCLPQMRHPASVKVLQNCPTDIPKCVRKQIRHSFNHMRITLFLSVPDLWREEVYPKPCFLWEHDENNACKTLPPLPTVLSHHCCAVLVN